MFLLRYCKPYDMRIIGKRYYKVQTIRYARLPSENKNKFKSILVTKTLKGLNDPTDILRLWISNEDDFDSIALAYTVHKIGSLGPSSLLKTKGHLEIMTLLYMNIEKNINSFNPRSLASILWGSVKCGIYIHESLLDKISNKIIQDAKKFSITDICMILWSYAHNPSSHSIQVYKVFDSILIDMNASNLECHSIVSLLNTYITLSVYFERKTTDSKTSLIFNIFKDEIERRDLYNFKVKELASILHSYHMTKKGNKEFYNRIGDHLLSRSFEGLTGQHTSLISICLAENGYVKSNLFNKIEKEVINYGIINLFGEETANLLLAFAIANQSESEVINKLESYLIDHYDLQSFIDFNSLSNIAKAFTIMKKFNSKIFHKIEVTVNKYNVMDLEEGGICKLLIAYTEIGQYESDIYSKVNSIFVSNRTSIYTRKGFVLQTISSFITANRKCGIYPKLEELQNKKMILNAYNAEEMGIILKGAVHNGLTPNTCELFEYIANYFDYGTFIEDSNPSGIISIMESLAYVSYPLSNKTFIKIVQRIKAVSRDISSQEIESIQKSFERYM